MHGTQIDIALSPAQAMLGEFLAYVRRGDVQAVHSLRRGVARHWRSWRAATAKLACGGPQGGRAAPAGGGAYRSHRSRHSRRQTSRPRKRRSGEAEVIIPRSHTVIESGDHVVFFLPNKRLVRNVENLFRVSATFF
jgi:trk system potassium uptake protein TrkA